MSWAGTPNTIAHHPNIRCDILSTPDRHPRWDPQESHQLFVAGDDIGAVLQLETFAEEGLSIRRTEVECVAREGE